MFIYVHLFSINTRYRTLSSLLSRNIACNSSFSYKGNLMGHIASVHEGKRPYECKICDKNFAAKHGLQKHLSAFHADILPLNFGIDIVNEFINTYALEIPTELK